MRLSISEVLKIANSKSKIEERVEVLQQNNSFALQHLLRFCFDPRIEWLLPKGDMDYETGSVIDQEGNFINRARELYLFVKAVNNDGVWVIGNEMLGQEKREMLFVRFLEGIDRNDAKLLISVKDKVMPFKNITDKVVLTAFPGLWS